MGRAEPTERTQKATAHIPAGDTVSLSAEAKAALADARTGELGPTHTTDADADAERGAGIYAARGHGPPAQTPGKAAEATEEPPTPPVDPTELTEHERKEVEELKAREVEVRRREQAHAAQGGSHAASPQYKYETGPDGRRYIVDGSVSINVEKIDGDVKATLRKMETVIGAATGSDNPSPHDRSVASEARALAQEARAELSAEAVGRGEEAADDASGVSGSPHVEESEEYGAATRPVRPHLKSLTDSLRAYQES